MPTAQITCAAVSYFEPVPQLDANGNIKKDKRGDDIVVDARRRASMGQLVEMTQSEFNRLVIHGAVQEPGSAPLPGESGPTATAFSQPIIESGEVTYSENQVGDPRSPGVAAAEELRGIKERLESDLAEDEEIIELDVGEASIEELTAWIRDDKPNAAEVVEAAEDEPVQASKLLEAEEAAFGDQARKSVRVPLEAIIAKGNTE